MVESGHLRTSYSFVIRVHKSNKYSIKQKRERIIRHNTPWALSILPSLLDSGFSVAVVVVVVASSVGTILYKQRDVFALGSNIRK